MAENVREVIRAAQAAELAGDKARAIELLRRAAEMYLRAGGHVRALQMLRHALRLDPTLIELAEEISRIDAASASASSGVGEASGSSGLDEGDDDGERAAWVIGEEVSRTSLEEALRQAEAAVDSRRDPVAQAVAGVQAVARVGLGENPGSSGDVAPSPPAPLPEGEGGGKEFIERGPTRADPSLEAWCSFCCRPRSEVGALVAGPAGAFICSSCVVESGALLGDVAPVTTGVRAPHPRVEVSVELIGQDAAQALLVRALQAGVRRLLILGPEGTGKSTWVRALEEQGRGVRVLPEALERAPMGGVLLLEDVDQLSPGLQASVGAFLARFPERTVLLTARGQLSAPALVLESDAGPLPVVSTAELSQAVGGSLPVNLLEQVQLPIMLEPLSVEALVEMARRRLAPRVAEGLSEEVLPALATQAARSPRAGYELLALLARVPLGAWRLESKRPSRSRKKAPPPPSRRGSRKKRTS
jgi:hypothetical protein